MKNRAKITFTAKFLMVDKSFFIEVQGYQLINGYIATKKLVRDNDGDFKYSSEWAIYDHFSGALISSASTPKLLLNNKATPAEILNKLRKPAQKNNIAKHREVLPAAENASHFALGKLPPLPKPKKETLSSGYTALNKLIALIDAEIKHCIALDGIDTQGLKNQETATQYGKIIFQFDRSKFTIWKRQENLRAFKIRVKSIKNAFKDALSTQPQHVASEWIQPPGTIIDGLKITDAPVEATQPAAQAKPEPVATVAPVEIKQPAKPLEPLTNTATYSLPEHAHEEWSMRKTADFKPTTRQIIVIKAVETAIDLGLRSSTEILDNAAITLNIDAETLKIGASRVDGGDFGMDCYYARDYIDAQRARKSSEKLAVEFNLKSGDLLGTIVTNDSKRTTGIKVISTRENGKFATITGKRGKYTTTGEMSIESIKRAIDRAVDYGSRKQTYNELIAKRAKTEPMAAPVTIDTLPSLTPKIEQPAKPLATTCNPDALRLRSKATMCRAANRPTWAEKLEAQADALERMDKPEPPPGNKATPANGKPKPQKCKHGTLHKIKAQRPHKTACIRLAKIRHPAKQKFGQPFRQNFNEAMAERLDSNNPKPTGLNLDTPPGIKTVTPSGNFYQTKPTTNRAKTHATPTI